VPRSFPLTAFALIYVIAISLLMISRIPTWSGKKIGARVPRDYVLPVFVVVVLFTALLISYPWEVLAFGSVFYLAAIPFAYTHFKRLEHAHAVAAGGGVVPAKAAEKEDRLGRLN
jgi:CDP-diacylglycerol--serine O-phosphatidyltransferase